MSKALRDWSRRWIYSQETADLQQKCWVFENQCLKFSVYPYNDISHFMNFNLTPILFRCMWILCQDEEAKTVLKHKRILTGKSEFNPPWHTFLMLVEMFAFLQLIPVHFSRMHSYLELQNLSPPLFLYFSFKILMVLKITGKDAPIIFAK